MSLNTNSIITYADLLTYTLDTIKARCHNIDSWNASVPAQLKNGTSWTLSSANVSHTVYDRTTATHTLSTTATVSDAVCSLTTSSVVQQQLNDYLNTKGVYQNPNEPVTFKGMINFYNVVSSFMSAKIWLVTNSFGAGTFVFYNPNGSTYPSVTSYNNLQQYTLAELQVNLQEVLASVNNSQNIHHAATVLSYNSSCSCSSSSSSSSFSSSSSSSS